MEKKVLLCLSCAENRDKYDRRRRHLHTSPFNPGLEHTHGPAFISSLTTQWNKTEIQELLIKSH